MTLEHKRITSFGTSETANPTTHITFQMTWIVYKILFLHSTLQNVTMHLEYAKYEIIINTKKEKLT
jgi:hypothetical protein